MEKTTPLARAVKIAGSQTALGIKLGKTQGHVSKWLQRDRLPPELVLKVEALTGVSRYELRPDVFGTGK